MDSACLHPTYKQLVAVAETWEYGSQHTHEEIAQILRVSPQSDDYYRAISAAKKELQAQGKAIKNIPKKGYEVIKPGEYVPEALRVVRQGFGKVRKATGMLADAPVYAMTEIERTSHRIVSDRTMAFMAHFAGTNVEMRMLAKR